MGFFEPPFGPHQVGDLRAAYREEIAIDLRFGKVLGQLLKMLLRLEKGCFSLAGTQAGYRQLT